MLGRVGFGPGDHIVTHCAGGGRAALGAAAAARAGFDDVRVYYLSFGDWVRDESCPVLRERGDSCSIAWKGLSRVCGTLTDRVILNPGEARPCSRC
ncbi:MAG: hypothetical protein JO213_07160 [Alphaproteobacteria bacterium]|nr:hypothetical protein [Alphaproteobacteria bacterium]MBV9152021.1 hypothetical protein [Alphaproteobacteria bacterium]MBV9584649.1 hypothetical protein [Alphaproteobacteria bacterium]